MSWMITDLEVLKGTCYIEVLPGSYREQFWNSESVFFKEEHFGFIEPTLLRHCSEYDHYSFTNINKITWGKILADLDQLRSTITPDARLADIKSEVVLFFMTSERDFLQDEANNLRMLRQMLDDFIRWVRKTLDQHETIAVLGI